MSDTMHPTNLLIALARWHDDLPNLIGQPGWAAIGPTLQSQMEQLRHSHDPDEQLRLTVNLLELIAPYDEARQRLSADIESLAILREVGVADLAAFAAQRDADQPTLEAAVNVALQSMRPELVEAEAIEGKTRDVFLKVGGKEGGQSFKLKNLFLDTGKLVETAANAAMAAFEIVGQTNPIMIVAKILLVIRELQKATTVLLIEQETSVYWGFIVLTNKKEDKIATEAEIIKTVNEERERWGFEQPLSADEVRQSLQRLQELKSVEFVPEQAGTWRLVERVKIAG